MSNNEGLLESAGKFHGYAFFIAFYRSIQRSSKRRSELQSPASNPRPEKWSPNLHRFEVAAQAKVMLNITSYPSGSVIEIETFGHPLRGNYVFLGWLSVLVH